MSEKNRKKVPSELLSLSCVLYCSNCLSLNYDECNCLS